MRVRGHVSHGIVIIDDGGTLPEGALVHIETVEEHDGASMCSESLSDQLDRLAGTATDLPDDLADNHDHYLHGKKKR